MCHHNVYGKEIQIPSTVGENQRVSGHFLNRNRAWRGWITLLKVRKFMKKLFSSLYKNKRKNFPKVKGQMTIFLSIKEFGRICQPVNTVAKIIARHERSREWEIDVQFMGNITSPKLMIRFPQDDGSSFTDRDRFNFIWKRSNKTRSQYC